MRGVARIYILGCKLRLPCRFVQRVVCAGARLRPSCGRDVESCRIQGFTAVRSVTGTEGALPARQGDEETTNERYGDGGARAVDFPADIRAVVERNDEDENRHLAYVREALAHRRSKHAA